MKTLIFSDYGFSKSFLVDSNDNKHQLSFTEKSLTEATADLAHGFEAVSLFTSDSGSVAILEKLKGGGINYIALRSTGYDHINLKKAESLGIKVANVPAYSPHSIAEHAVALIMSMNRKIVLGQTLMHQNDFRLDQLIGFDIYGKTVGIIGTGKIGAAFTSIMHGFGCALLGYDVQKNLELIRDTKIMYTSFERLCQSADIISIHCPLNESTRHLFNKKCFSSMKKSVIIINTSRGGIINTHDLLDALDQGVVAYAGLDVYENEMPIFFRDHKTQKIGDELFNKLREHPRILLTGHQAFLTNEALAEIANTTIANLDSWENGGTSQNEIV